MKCVWRKEWISGKNELSVFKTEIHFLIIFIILMFMGKENFWNRYVSKDEGSMKWSEVKSLSRVWLFATLWTVAHQAPPSMGFSRQEYWSGLTFPFPGDFPNPGIEPKSPALQADTLTSEPPGKSLSNYLYKGFRWLHSIKIDFTQTFQSVQV